MVMKLAQIANIEHKLLSSPIIRSINVIDPDNKGSGLSGKIFRSVDRQNNPELTVLDLCRGEYCINIEFYEFTLSMLHVVNE